MHDVNWVKGAPDHEQPGMVLRFFGRKDLHIVGSNSLKLRLASVEEWAWLCKPHELEWLCSKTGNNRADSSMSANFGQQNMVDPADVTITFDTEAYTEAYTGAGGVMIRCPDCIAEHCACIAR